MGVTKLLEDQQGADARIDRYDLIAEIASGGMATVYLGRLSGVGGFQRSFAIKRLHPHLASNIDFVQMFLDEARLAAMIRHPNVVPILEVGQAPLSTGATAFYLVMEYIEGDTFASLLSKTSARGHRIPISISLRIVIDMLHGLHAAHELKDDHGRYVGLVHRDVSPQNVLVGTDGVTRITDFGVARAASALSETRAGQLKGKLAYMAPEQASGVEDVDRRADVFSSGVVLWESLAFRRLFKAKNEATTLSRVLKEPLISPAQHNPDVPDGVAQVCLRALDRDLHRRYSSCAEFAAELEKVALALGQLATVKDVADYVQQIIGHDVESHRAAIRRWIERKELSGSLPPISARASMPPESSVTRASLPPPPPSSRLPSGVTGASPSLLPPPSVGTVTHSGVIVTPAARRRRTGLYLGLSLAIGGAAAAAYWGLGLGVPPESEALLAPPSAAPTVNSIPPNAAELSDRSEPSPSAAGMASAAEASAASGATPTALSSDQLPEEPDESEPEVAEKPKSPSKDTRSRRSGRRQPTRPPKKTKELPNLENPYQ